LAPDQEVPQALLDALERNLGGAELAEEVDDGLEVPGSSASGSPPMKVLSLGQEQQAHTSTKSGSDFEDEFCNFNGSQKFQWCHLEAFDGAFATDKAHRFHGALCGNRSDASWVVPTKSGNTQVVEVNYGECHTWALHFGHKVVEIWNFKSTTWYRRTRSFFVLGNHHPVQFAGYTDNDHSTVTSRY
jgi:hypothetical protein